MQIRTQVYLEPAQHAALVRESRRLRLSLAGLVRKLIEEHVLGKGPGVPNQEERKRGALGLIGLGASGLSDVSERIDDHLAQAIYEEATREGRSAYKARVKKTKRRGG